MRLRGPDSTRFNLKSSVPLRYPPRGHRCADAVQQKVSLAFPYAWYKHASLGAYLPPFSIFGPCARFEHDCGKEITSGNTGTVRVFESYLTIDPRAANCKMPFLTK